ncbi:hypothetical protein [Pseudomonas aeruginosa]|uniref:hypothetical protein n=1 Tax=Pseudomonas aeruginosa TaxID=287 RepID=UPI00071B19C5|nr:hypothetical protein [Pseudomonas aeruginosa]
MREFHDLILSDWDVNLLDIIYAHESDPTDVFATIERIHSGRETALKSFGGTDLPPDFSTTSNLVESVFRAGDGSEKAFYRRFGGMTVADAKRLKDDDDGAAAASAVLH